MRNKRWIVAAAALLLLSSAGQAYASQIRIIGESEEALVESADPADQAAAPTDAITDQPQTEAAETEADDGKILNPAAENITAEDAVTGARTLYSQMQHYADINDNGNFAALFEEGADAKTVQDQLQAVKSSLPELRGLDQHCDVCFFDPTRDTTQSPYYFAVALCDYDVDAEGAVAWYSTLIRTACYRDGWKVSVMSPGELLSQQFPEAFRDAKKSGRNAVDLYPSLALRFTAGAVFDGALYALPNLLWQNEDGSAGCAVWIANGTGTTKWCDTIDLVARDEKLKKIMAVNVPVQQALEAGASTLVICTVPAEYIETETQEWTEVSMNSNLRYQ